MSNEHHLGELTTIRNEANSVKDCFTRFSFQAFVLEAVIFGLVLKFQHNEPIVTLVGGVGIIMMIVVSRIGTHKYATANRNFGFELFLSSDTKLSHIVSVSWEEALRAWRIVQATLYEKIFKTKEGAELIDKNGSVWFQVKTLLGDNVCFHAGSYLRTMLKLQEYTCYAGCCLFFLPIGQELIDLLNSRTNNDVQSNLHLLKGNNVIAILLAVIGIMLLYFVRREYIKRNLRRIQLEEGFLSIHSCAKMWAVISIAHSLAKCRVGDSLQDSYIERLADEAKDLTSDIENICHIDKWIVNKVEALKEEKSNKANSAAANQAAH